ncbi:MAG: four helix bundle protein [Gemmataceae bacterium]|nr:four helix bundle protein [Gemmataceae bacterium]
MSAIRSHRDLVVWQEGIKIVETCYRLTETFPKSQVYGLAQQLQRAAVSVPANIAEGNGRDSLPEYLHHLSIAYGSLMEIDSHIEVARRVGFIDEPTYSTLLEQLATTGRLLNALQRSLKNRHAQGQRHPATIQSTATGP